MDTEDRQAVQPSEVWARSLTAHELATELERAFGRGSKHLTLAQRNAILAEAARRLRWNFGEAHRESQEVPEKFRHG